MRCPVRPDVLNALVLVLAIVLLGLLVGGRGDRLREASELVRDVLREWSSSTSLPQHPRPLRRSRSPSTSGSFSPDLAVSPPRKGL